MTITTVSIDLTNSIVGGRAEDKLLLSVGARTEARCVGGVRLIAVRKGIGVSVSATARGTQPMGKTKVDESQNRIEVGLSYSRSVEGHRFAVRLPELSITVTTKQVAVETVCDVTKDFLSCSR